MESIARSARLNKAMLHYYFKNKKALHAHVVRSLIESEWEQDAPFLELARDLAPLQRLYFTLHGMAYRHLRGKDPTLRRIMAWELAEGGQAFHEVYRRYVVPRMLLNQAFVQQGMDDGVFRKTDPLLVIWNAISFFVLYSMQKESYQGTELHNQLYNQRGMGHLLDHMLETTARMLDLEPGFPEPEMPDNVRNVIKKMRKEIYAQGKKRVAKK